MSHDPNKNDLYFQFSIVKFICQILFALLFVLLVKLFTNETQKSVRYSMYICAPGIFLIIGVYLTEKFESRFPSDNEAVKLAEESYLSNFVPIEKFVGYSFIGLGLLCVVISLIDPYLIFPR